MNHHKSPRNGKLYHRLRALLINLNKDLWRIASKIPTFEAEFDEFDYLVMAIEDRRYLNHRGIDIVSIGRETVKMLLRKKHGGASTIDMQMVRTLTNYREVTIRRKLYEMTLALIVNFKYTKFQIMKCYMDNAFFGSHLIGITSASQCVYGRPLSSLTEFEKARLAAMLLKPRPRTPSAEWESAIDARATYAQSRRRLVKNSNK
jgi:membrane peptidoglycan carboxypeptidase